MFRLMVLGLAVVLLAGFTRAEPPPVKCRVTAKLVSTEYEKAGGKVEGAISTVTGPSGPMSPKRAKNDEVSIELPPGTYSIQFSGNGSRGATFEPVKKKVVIEDGVTKLDLGTVDMPASTTTRLFGKPVPEFEKIAEWKNTDALTMKRLRGKVVVLEFWSHTCSICLSHKPDVVKLVDRYKDEKVSVLTVHQNTADTIDDVEGRLPERVKKAAMSLPIALDSKGPKSICRSLGIGAVPAVLLADTEGKIVRRFHTVSDPELDKEIQTLLDAPKK